MVHVIPLFIFLALGPTSISGSEAGVGSPFKTAVLNQRSAKSNPSAVLNETQAKLSPSDLSADKTPPVTDQAKGKQSRWAQLTLLDMYSDLEAKGSVPSWVKIFAPNRVLNRLAINTPIKKKGIISRKSLDR
ncbi:MAG: hypothetical protein HQK59_14090 [Deltaproteobacteria bacterium]|nr:hypothetical protein [Deltaproteobacteria bacterium]